MELKPDWMLPANENDPGDTTAADDGDEFSFGLFGDPIFKGDYSETVKQRGKTNLKQFSDGEKTMLKGENLSHREKQLSVRRGAMLKDKLEVIAWTW